MDLSELRRQQPGGTDALPLLREEKMSKRADELLKRLKPGKPVRRKPAAPAILPTKRRVPRPKPKED